MSRGPRPIDALRLCLRIARFQPLRFGFGMLLWTAWWSLPALVGLALQAAFDAVADGAQAGFDVPAILGLLLAVEFARLVVFYGGVVVLTRWWIATMSVLRANMLRAQLTSSDTTEHVSDASGSIPLFRDDVEDVLMYMDSWVDMAGATTFATIALIIMLRVDALITLVVVVPLVVVFIMTRLLAERIRGTRRDDREATARVTGFLGNVFSSVLAVKVAGAEDRAVARLRGLNDARRKTALRDRLLKDMLDAFSGSTVDVAIGLVLLLVAADMRSGAFSLGDLALFTAYLSWLSALPRWAGLMLTRHRHAQVAIGRMSRLLPGGEPADLAVPRQLSLSQPPQPLVRPRPARPRAADVRLSGFGVRRDGVVSPGIDLRLAPGSFTVVSGPVGSGKTTLLRALLGLAGPVEGRVEWDGEPVCDLAAHMVLPRCGYVPQSPRLFSASLRDNLTLGMQTSDPELASALGRAAFDTDVAGMDGGLDTVVGPRGVRLSGGQLQRAATARALVADPALLVCDDLSSALDAQTEQWLWARLLDGHRPTALVVSHRAAAFAHADQIVLLDDGRVRAIGTPAELEAAGLHPLQPSSG